MEIIKCRFPINYILIQTQNLINETKRENRIEYVINLLSPQIQRINNFINSNDLPYEDVELFCMLCNKENNNTPTEWLKIYLGTLLISIAEKMNNSSKEKCDYLQEYYNFGLLYKDNESRIIDPNELNIENYEKFIILLNKTKIDIERRINNYQ